MTRIRSERLAGSAVKGIPGLRSPLEAQFRLAARAHGLPEPKEEYHFAAEQVGLGPGLRARLRAAGLRDWRFDFAWPKEKVAVECEGGVFSRGRHTRGRGYAADCEKYNAAAALGWALIRATGEMLVGNPIGVCRQVERLLAERKAT